MHWIEGVIIICVGALPWLVASGGFPADQQQRMRLERAMPVVRNRLLMRGLGVFLWLFGGLVVANSLLGLGIPL